MKEREELELILNLMRKYNLPLSPILEYAIKEKVEEFPAKDLANEVGETTSEIILDEGETYTYYHVNDADLLPKSYDVKWFGLSALACLEGQMDKRSYQILTDMLKGDSRSEIAERNHLTQERIRQIVVKSTKQAKELLIELRKSNEDTKSENAQLKTQLKLLKENIARLKALLPKETITRLGDENEEPSTELASLLETPIENLNFPVRAANILMYMGIKKFADIPQIYSSIQVLKARNSGRKTVHDISLFLEDFYLSFGMSYTEIVNVLKVKDWHVAKRKWIRQGLNKENVKKQKENENNKKNGSTSKAFNKTPSNVKQYNGDERIGYTV